MMQCPESVRGVWTVNEVQNLYLVGGRGTQTIPTNRYADPDIRFQKKIPVFSYYIYAIIKFLHIC